MTTNVIFVPFRARSRSRQESSTLDAATEWILSELEPEIVSIEAMHEIAEKEIRRPRDAIHRKWATVFLEEIDWPHAVDLGRKNEISEQSLDQARVWKWIQEVFSDDIVKSPEERAMRFLEEALELVQAVALTREDCHRLVDYVFNRPKGEPSQEIGGVSVTLYALASAIGINVGASARTEIERIETPEIRQKVIRRQAEKRKEKVGA